MPFFLEIRHHAGILMKVDAVCSTATGIKDKIGIFPLSIA
jgi:hypothetical protein